MVHKRRRCIKGKAFGCWHSALAACRPRASLLSGIMTPACAKRLVEQASGSRQRKTKAPAEDRCSTPSRRPGGHHSHRTHTACHLATPRLHLPSLLAILGGRVGSIGLFCCGKDQGWPTACSPAQPRWRGRPDTLALAFAASPGRPWRPGSTAAALRSEAGCGKPCGQVAVIRR